MCFRQILAHIETPHQKGVTVHAGSTGIPTFAG